MQNSNIYCIGDSHVSVFLGFDALAPVWPNQVSSMVSRFKVFRIGSITAHNLCESVTSTMGKERILSILEGIPKKSWVLLSAGEIDCRVHLIKQSVLQCKSYQDICRETINRYINFVNEIKNLDYNICLLVPPPTSFKNVSDPEYPMFGTEEERNEITLCFNSILQDECKKYNIKYIEVSSKSITESLHTVRSFLWDGVHLSTLALPILVGQLKDATKMNIKLSKSWFFREFLRSIKKNILKRIS